MKTVLLILILSFQAEAKETYTHYFCENENHLYKLSQNDIEVFKKGPEPDSKAFCQKLKNRPQKQTFKTGPAIVLQGKKLNE